jgi:hypothetical protein
VTVLPQAESSSRGDGRLRTRVPVIPDVPVGHFRLTLLGGRKGYLVNSGDLCRRAPVITVQYQGQSGKSEQEKIKPTVPCGKGHKRGSRRHRR